MKVLKQSNWRGKHVRFGEPTLGEDENENENKRSHKRKRNKESAALREDETSGKTKIDEKENPNDLNPKLDSGEANNKERKKRKKEKRKKSQRQRQGQEEESQKDSEDKQPIYVTQGNEKIFSKNDLIRKLIKHGQSELINGFEKRNFREKKSFRKGKWSLKEDTLLKQTILDQLDFKKVDMKDFQEFLSSGFKKEWKRAYTKAGKQINGFWSAIAAYFPNRSCKSVMDRGIRLFHPNNYKGFWEKKKIRMLRKMVQQHGRKWERFGEHFDRPAFLCRDVYDRDYHLRTKTRRGWWTEEEEIRFIKLVVKYATPAQRNTIKKSIKMGERLLFPKKNIPFAIIAKKMNRPPTYLLNKWYGQLHAKATGHNGSKWSMKNDKELVLALYEVSPEDESDINFNGLLPYCTGRYCVEKFRLLCQLVPSKYETLEEKLDYLYKEFKDKNVDDICDSDSSDSESSSDEDGVERPDYSHIQIHSDSDSEDDDGY